MSELKYHKTNQSELNEKSMIKILKINKNKKNINIIPGIHIKELLHKWRSDSRKKHFILLAPLI